MQITILEPLGIENELLKKSIQKLERLGHKVKYYDTKPQREETTNRCKDAEILLLTNTAIDESTLKECKDLQMISAAFTGYDHININQAKEQGIEVTNTPGYATDSVAELTFSLIFELYRKIDKANDLTREGKTKDTIPGIELKGKTLGIVGTGRIGSRVAELGKAFGCDLIGYNRSEKDECKGLGLKYVKLEDLISESDIISLHIPLNAGTENLFNSDTFKQMKKSSILINTARGGLVNESDLADALNDEIISGAGIDVFQQEPPLDKSNPLISAKNTILTPHIAYATKEALDRRAEIAFSNVYDWLNGECINSVI